MFIVLLNHHVFFQPLDLLIRKPFLAFVRQGSGRRQHLDNDRRFGDVIIVLFVRTANYNQVGVVKTVQKINPELDLIVKHSAISAIEMVRYLSQHVKSYPIMPLAGARHSINFAVQILMADLGDLLAFDVILNTYLRLEFRKSHTQEK